MLEKIDLVIDEIKAIDESKSKKLNELFNVFKAFCKERYLFPIVVKGYTPSFNDGEPCTHIQSEICDPAEYEYMYEDDLQLLENINKNNINKANFIKALKDQKTFADQMQDNKQNNHLSGDELGKLTILLDWLTDYFKEEYQTDFKLTMYHNFNTNEFVIEKEDYYVD